MARDVRTEPPGLPLGDDPTGRLLQAVEAAFASSVARPPDRAKPKPDGEGSIRLTAAEDALREQVRVYVRALRHDGATPERVLVAVKDLVRRALPRPGTATRRSDADALLTRIVEWTVSDYYRAD
jgi:hypothetical protein